MRRAVSNFARNDSRPLCLSLAPPPPCPGLAFDVGIIITGFSPGLSSRGRGGRPAAAAAAAAMAMAGRRLVQRDDYLHGDN